ncbi:MAG: diaminopimelate epimerase [Candidatus Omnitrophica bacterium]|nr:diaminopimelate epimerase [Candidatus Omnitrophota bacterium]MCM8790517.1 diaminopimelate epimerase [Candidatus Omnitrophota bacterium]
MESLKQRARSAAITFTKAVATGNDFIIIDNRSRRINDLNGLARNLCDRKWSVGADGMLVIERSKRSDFRMRIFNRDGSEAEMCGNGSRCAALYAAVKKIAPRQMTIDTVAGELKASVQGNMVKVLLTEPKDIKWNLCLMINKCPYKLDFVNTGVPHVVHFVDDLENIDVRSLGSHIRNHGEFAPAGTNADFVKVVDKNTIRVRTYERGVEDETLACGTGSVASAIIAAEAEKMSSPITVETRSGEKLKVYFDLIDGNFKNVYLEGKAQLVFEGKIRI